MQILRIDSSAQTEISQSRRLSDRIVDGLRALGKSSDVTVRDLNERLPQLDRAWIEANTTPIDNRTDDQRKTLALSDTLIAEIEAADTLIIGVALYNFSIPASLKLWIDLVCRARKTFTYSEDGPKGLMAGKRQSFALSQVAQNSDQILISQVAIYVIFLASLGSQMLYSSLLTNDLRMIRH